MKYYIALYQKLKEIYLTQNSQINEAVLICPSLRLYEMEDLELLKPQSQLNDPTKITDSILKKQQVSYELNSLPFSNQYWDLNPGNTLFDAYRDILNYAVVKDLEQGLENVILTENAKLYENGKETKELKAYRKQMDAYDKKLLAIEEHLKRYNEFSTDEEKENWNEQLGILKSKKNQALANWNITGYKLLIDNALKSVNKLSDADRFLDLFQSVKNHFESAEKTDVTTLSSLHDINFIPYNFMEDESGWSYLMLDKNELESLFTSAKNSNEELPAEILDIEYDEKYIESIELDYSFIHLKRGWFNKDILHSEYFQWKESQQISDGTTISAAFKLPAYPKTMLLIKNLKINLNDAVSEELVNNQNQLIHFGPMILKQQLFVNKNTNRKFLKTITNKEIIKSDQMNYLIRKADESETHEKNISPNVNINPNINRINLDVTRNLVPKTVTINPAANKFIIEKQKIELSRFPFKKADLFTKIEGTIVSSVSRVFFNITDSNTKNGIYKCSLSIKGNDNNRVYEVETDENGQITVFIPVGSYHLETRCDGYEIMKNNFTIENTNPMSLSYSLIRQEIKFKSYFLVGMVCERIPKTPK